MLGFVSLEMRGLVCKRQRSGTTTVVSSSHGQTCSKFIVGIVILAFVDPIILIAIFICYWCSKRRNNKNERKDKKESQNKPATEGDSIPLQEQALQEQTE